MEFSDCKNLLIIRPDNMGDLLMSVPAIRALRQSFNCRITILGGRQTAEIARLITEIDEHVAADFAFMPGGGDSSSKQLELIRQLSLKNFDGCIVLNVYSQNPAPALQLAYLAGIPLRAAYSREHLYALLTHWMVDEEPYTFIRHQVARELALVCFLGAKIADPKMSLQLPPQPGLINKLRLKKDQYLVIHTGVSEIKREYPKLLWIELGKLLTDHWGIPLLFTGTAQEQQRVEAITAAIGAGAISVAGKTSIAELSALIAEARAVITLNSAPMHLAAALGRPVVALYAQTNPQHKPWMVASRVLEYSVPGNLKSVNAVLAFVDRLLYPKHLDYPAPDLVLNSLVELLAEVSAPLPSGVPDQNQLIWSSRS